MTVYFLVKYLHVIGAIVILGTGAGIAFFMLMAHRSGDAAFIARTAATVVIADNLVRRALACHFPRALCPSRSVLDSRDLHANRDARSGKRRGG